MKSSRTLLILLATAGLSAAHPVFAQPSGDGDPDESEQTKDDRRARDLYVQGEDDYAAGRYEQAADKFEQAYALSKRPALLFNLGNAYERMGEYEKAAEYLRRYVDSPRAKDVVSVRERIRRLEAAARKRKAEEGKRDPGDGDGGGSKADADDGTSSADPRTSDVRPPPKQSRRGAYIVLAVGGALVANSLVFGLASGRAGDEAAAHCAADSDVPLCLSEAEGPLARESRYALIADISTAAAVVSLGIGLYMALKPGGKSRPSPPDASARLGPVLLPDGFGVGVSGGF